MKCVEQPCWWWPTCKWDRIRLHILNEKTIRIKYERQPHIWLNCTMTTTWSNHSFQQMLIHSIDFFFVLVIVVVVIVAKNKDMKIQINLVNLFILINIAQYAKRQKHSQIVRVLFNKKFPEKFYLWNERTCVYEDSK